MSMIHLLILAVHLLATIAKLVRPGGVRVVVAEILVDKAPVAHQQPRAAAGAEPEFVRSLRFGSWVTVRSGKPASQARGYLEARNANIDGFSRRVVIDAPAQKGRRRNSLNAIVEFKRRNPRIGCSMRRGQFGLGACPGEAARPPPSLEVTPSGLPTTVTSQPLPSRRLATRLASARVTASIRPERRSM
jgi:hypothetical protein